MSEDLTTFYGLRRGSFQLVLYGHRQPKKIPAGKGPMDCRMGITCIAGRSKGAKTVQENMNTRDMYFVIHCVSPFYVHC
jgi:hypothetical protein